MRWSEADLRQVQTRLPPKPGRELKQRALEVPILTAHTSSKYHNRRTEVDGIKFDSELEARCYQELQLRQKAGEVKWFVRQVSFRLEGNVAYRADFLAVLASGGVEVIDAKGMDTQVSKNKRKQLKARYGIDVILWTDKRS